MNPFVVKELIRRALEEDIGPADITTLSCVPEGHLSKAIILAKESFVLAGLDVAREAFLQFDSSLVFKKGCKDGEVVSEGQAIASVEGNTRSILTVERTALNFLQKLSGIATLTRRFVEQTQGTGATVLDTRKTTPTLRILEKYAVSVGGGSNHRFGLYDGILIKDNHIRAAGGVREAIRRVKAHASGMLKIEVEVNSLEELREALKESPHIVMLDNMPIEDVRKAVELVRQIAPQTEIEVSGGVSLETVGEIARAGVDYISIGALTHSARAVDISLEIL